MSDCLPVISPDPVRLEIDPGVDLWAVARAAGAGVTAKQVRRAMERAGGSRSGSGGAMLTVSLNDADAEAAMAAGPADIAVATARMLRLGRFGAQRRADLRRAAAPPPKPKERRVSTNSHPWKRGDKGRSVRTVEGGHQQATLTCRCGDTHSIRFRELAQTDQMDRKFIQAGWRLDPALCPTCQPQKEKTLSANPSPAVIQSQARMFRMLGEHFDVDAGRYADGWSDARIAKETSLSAAMVAGVREEAFGPIKEPAEVAALAADIEALGQMIAETLAPIQTELEAMRVRIADLRRKFSA